MSGKDESARLQGMLSELAGTVGEMGAGRDWGANAIRQIARPDNQARFRGQKFGLDNSANLMKMAQWSERNGYEDQATRYHRMSYDLADRERQTEEKLAVQRGRSEIADLQNQMTQLYLDPGIPDGERTQEVARLQQEINAIARKVPNMDPTKYANVSQNMDEFYAERKRAEAAERRSDAQLEAQLTRLDLDKNADARATQRHQQLQESGQLEIEGARVTQQINKMTLASKLASAYVGQEGGKEAFLSREGMEEYGGLYDQVELQYETAQAELDAAKAALAENAGFNYSQEKLEEMLYLMPDPVAAAKQLRNIADGGVASSAHQQLIKMLDGQTRTNKVPEATLLKLFNNMAVSRLEAEKSGTAAGPYAYQETASWYESSEGDEAQALGNLNAAMLNAWLSAPSPQQGIADVQLILTYGINGSGDDKPGGTGNTDTDADEPSIEELAAQLGITTE